MFFKNPKHLFNKEIGRRVFILANGPSIKMEDLTPLRNEIVIGMNASTIIDESLGLRCKYYVLSDLRFLTASEKRPWATQKINPVTHRVIRSDLKIFDDPALYKQSTYITPLSRDGFSQDLDEGFYYDFDMSSLSSEDLIKIESRDFNRDILITTKYSKSLDEFYDMNVYTDWSVTSVIAIHGSYSELELYSSKVFSPDELSDLYSNN
jgi:hypothetical protein